MAPVTGAAVLAQLPPGRGCSVVRDGNATIVAIEPTAVRSASGEDAFARLTEAARDGFWIGYLAYDLGRHVERVRTRIPDDLRLPDLVLARYDARLVLEPGSEPRVVGDGPAAALLAQAAWRARREQAPPFHGLTSAWTSSFDRASYGHAVDTILELLDAGECYQVNLTRRLESAAAVDPVGLYLALDRWNPAPHAALCTFGPHLPALAVVSASPELFLRVDGRRVVTRPIKGTAADRATLRIEREGPRRERDDRRPRAQRPRPRLRVRLDHGAGAVRDRIAPRPPPPREHGGRHVAGRCRTRRAACARRSHRRPSPAHPSRA